MSSCYYICVLMLRYIYVRILLCKRTIYVSSHYSMCPHTTILMSPRRLYMCPHPAECVSSSYYVSSYYYIYPHTAICVLILLYMCPRTTIYVSSCCFIYVAILLYRCARHALVRRAAMPIASRCYANLVALLCQSRRHSQRVLPYMCPTTICVLILL